MLCHCEVGPRSSLHQSWRSHFCLWTRFHKTSLPERNVLIPLLRSPTNRTAIQLSSTCRRPRSVPCRLPSCRFRVRELPLVHISCFCELPHHDLDHLCSYNPSFFLKTWLLEPALCLTMDLCISFNWLLDEDSLLTIPVVTNLNTEGQLRYSLYCCLES